MEWVPESIRLFAICEAMKWSHLPIHGGIYDQSPQLMDEWVIIFERRAAYEKAKADREAHGKR